MITTNSTPITGSHGEALILGSLFLTLQVLVRAQPITIDGELRSSFRWERYSAAGKLEEASAWFTTLDEAQRDFSTTYGAAAVTSSLPQIEDGDIYGYIERTVAAR